MISLRLYATGALCSLLVISTAAEGAELERLAFDVPERVIHSRNYEASGSIALGEPGGHRHLRLSTRAAAKDVHLRLRGVRGIAYHRGLHSRDLDKRTSEDLWPNYYGF